MSNGPEGLPCEWLEGTAYALVDLRTDVVHWSAMALFTNTHHLCRTTFCGYAVPVDLLGYRAVSAAYEDLALTCLECIIHFNEGS